jgi:hypothetical protein
VVSQTRNQAGRPLPAVPATWPGSDLEWYVFRALLQHGLKPDVDFIYQYSVAGGRLDRGGSIPDFFLPDRRMGINPQGRYYHTRNSDQRAHDRIQREMLEGMGIRMFYPSEDDVLANAYDTIGQCLRGTYAKGPADA